MKKQANKTTLQILFSLFAALILVACGGGGGGSGSGAPPKNIEIDLGGAGEGADASACLTEDDQIRVVLKGGNTNLTATLNDINISSLFVDDNKGSERAKKVNVYALQGILSEKEKSTLKITLPGSSPASKELCYQGKPELVFTNVEGGSGRGFDQDSDSLKEYTNIKGEEVTHDIKVAEWGVNDKYIPLEEEYFSHIDGLVRNALAKSIKSGFEVFNGGKEFKVLSNRVSHSEKAPTEADYTFQVTSTNEVQSTINLAIPGKDISDIFAIKLNKIEKEHVISAWVDDALRAYMAEIEESSFESFEVSAQKCGQLFDAAGQNSEAITGIPQDDLNDDSYSCHIKVTGISAANAEASVFETTIEFLKLESENLEEGWRVKALVKAIKPLTIKMELSTEYYDGTDVLEGNPTNLTVVIEEPSIELTVGIGRTANEYFALDIHSVQGPERYPGVDGVQGRKKNTTESLKIIYEKIGSASSKFQNCTNGNCDRDFHTFLNGAVKSEINEALGLFAGDKAYCWQPYTINSDSFEDEDYALCNYESNTVEKPWEKLTKLPDTPIFVDAEAAPKEIVSVIEQELTGSRFSAEGKGKSVPGFVSISGTHKARNDGVHINALGTHYAPEVAVGKVKTADLQSTNTDAVVALSSNSINQALLSAYQSKQLQLELEPTLDSLGLSTFESGGYKAEFAKDKTVKVSADFKAAPYVRFIDGYIEVVIRNLELFMDLDTNATCSLGETSAPCTVKTMSNSNKTVVDIKARAKPNLNGGSLLQFSADDIMLDLSTNGITVSVTAFGQVKQITLSKKQLQSQIYPYIKSMLEDKLAWEVREKSLPVCYEEPESTFHNWLNSFIPEDTPKTLQLQAKSFEFDTQKGESAHILLGADIVDGDKVQESGLGIIKLVLKNAGECVE